ncbi:TPA: hypothetical protein DCZ31_03600 [Patescibacteria group bacterium]|nr:hypothetical protein [Candidatus Gracilibacteria bacterium]
MNSTEKFSVINRVSNLFNKFKKDTSLKEFNLAKNKLGDLEVEFSKLSEQSNHTPDEIGKMTFLDRQIHAIK